MNFALDVGVRPRVAGGAMIVKFLDILRSPGAKVGLLLSMTLGATGCAPTPPPPLTPAPVTPARPDAPVNMACRKPGWTEAASANAASVRTLAWAPFGRPETGWDIYAPLIQNEILTTCPADSEGFAAALADWQEAHGRNGDGVLTEALFLAFKGEAQARRAFVRFTSLGQCPDTPDLIMAARIDEGYGGKQIWLRPGAMAAYRQMVAAARAEVPEIAADSRNLTIFSGYRSPSTDAARCTAEGNCDGVVRARCSAHRTGLAVDIYVGQAEGYGPDSTADPNRLAMTRTPTYRWLLANARRFGFVNYAFEPWHWEWTGEPP